MFCLRYEGDVGDSHLPADEPLLLRQDRLQDAQNTLDLVAVPIDSAGNLLRVEVGEPSSLAEVGALARGLEVEPLKLMVALVAGYRDPVLGVVLINQVLDDSI